jgi:hypothetical protein
MYDDQVDEVDTEREVEEQLARLRAMLPTLPKCGRCGEELMLVVSGLICRNCTDARIQPVFLFIAESERPVTVTGLESTTYKRGSGWSCRKYTDKEILRRILTEREPPLFGG